MFTKNKNKNSDGLEQTKGINKTDNLDQTIVDLRKGSAEAFQILYRKYNRKIYRFCLRMLNDEMLAEDAYQETFIKVYEHRRDFRGENFTAWLYTIARRSCLNIIRTKKQYEPFNELAYKTQLEAQRDIALKDILDKAIMSLPIPLREAVLLREYEECSYKEIADILDIQLSLAKVRVYRAREILRKILTPIKRELHES